MVITLCGVDNHIHIITEINPGVALSSLMKDVKVSSSIFIKKQELFEGFYGWGRGYGAFTYSVDAKDGLIEYVKNQEEHHRKVSFREEYIALLEEHEVEFDERYVF
ncbi:MAG: hypothetical protein FH748_06560 [Balneolaceae bacterium]|nr:hypothetical protein [Balneolaceae bacterium]